MNFKTGLFLLFLIPSIHKRISAQSLIVGIPSADVAEKKHLELTHESQVNFDKSGFKWNGFNFICYGLTPTSEITLNFNNLDNEGSKNLAIGTGLKKIFPILYNIPLWENKIIIGGNGLYSTQKNEIGCWVYGLYSFRIPKLKTRLTGGYSYGTYQIYGFKNKSINNQNVILPFNTFSFLVGIEQPIYKHISFIVDWYSGEHEIAAMIPAIQFDLGHHVAIIGYKMPNNNTGNYIMLEFMYNIFNKK